MRRFVILVLMVLLAMSVVAQDAKQESKPARNDFNWARSPYRLDYTIKEMDDSKVVNSRTYSLAMQSAEERGRSLGEVKTGSRVPISTQTGKDGGSSIQYVDVGMSIQAQLYLLENSNLLLTGSVEFSTLASGTEAVGAGGAPIIRQVRSQTTSEVTAGKANQVAALDDPVSKHRFVIEVTPVKLR